MTSSAINLDRTPDPWADEFPEGGAQLAQESTETRMDRRGPAGGEVDDSITAAHPDRNVPGSSTAAPAVNVNILALDIGTHTGWALRRRDGTVIHGTENFTPRANWSPGQRWQRFRSWLSSLIVREQINVIAYEQVIQGGWAGGHAGHRSGAAGDVYGGFKALVELAADSHNLAVHAANVATVKKQFTGNGRAKKEDIITECKRRGYRPDSDNAADALAILDWAVAREIGEWKPAPKKPRPKSHANGMRRPPARPVSHDLFGVKP